MSGGAIAFLVMLVIVVLLFLFTYLIPVRLWIAAWAAGIRVSILTLVGMRLRRVPPSIIVNSLVMSQKAGLDIKINDLEAHYLAGGNVYQVVKALIAAEKANLNLAFARAAAIDLAGRDVLDAIQMSVKPRVIDCPDPTKGKEMVEAVAMDGIQLKAKARVTVRANIERLVGGATEETVIARVGEGVVSTIGSSKSYKDVLENPDNISKTVLGKGLDSGTAFEILSIDIADVDVGKNVGAELQAAQAETDKKIAQARAEGRRAMAVAEEQEMKARTQEMRAKVTEAEAEVPKAISQAFREGKLGIMDYYRMRNVQADTDMRGSISKMGPEEGK
ncbi:hypothetical protein AUJ66_02795 [Candidatus Desantisbacteria bacterium CG1_02_38_46]|uniref:Flotillin-like protein FloA n=3 Tax=unclassified Candidatus Desantisiibacteriota TaxID=3106372 RepID=A0A2H9P9Y1_9BACT|nr:MAG: hypothetical protein AUJ66_02795 [Candidatus Desantisbacteria bacterium CG1_02_38_46]PIZ15112.1 MAG: hypothetical protein COY51_06200 [Candidatus Desantisbacteria bacterium CG_4_10_14_0_8_um_filter_39_17]